MKLRTIRLTMEVQAKTTELAAGIAEGAAQHLLDTFNDDRSIREPIGWQVDPLAPQTPATQRRQALILAGLRALQSVSLQADGDIGELQDILEGTAGPEDLSLPEEIDDLCGEINAPD